MRCCRVWGTRHALSSTISAANAHNAITSIPALNAVILASTALVGSASPPSPPSRIAVGASVRPTRSTGSVWYFFFFEAMRPLCGAALCALALALRVRGEEAKPQPQRVVVVHPPYEAPDDAEQTIGFVSTAWRTPPYFRSISEGVTEGLEAALALAFDDGAWVWEDGSSPTPPPVSPTARPTPPPRWSPQPEVLAELGKPTWTGAGTRVFVLDSGCRADHDAFAHHALEDGRSFASPKETSLGDAHGHGTFVASLIARAAPHARITCVRVVDEAGRGTLSSLAFALAWVAQRCMGTENCVVHLSVGVQGDTPVLHEALEHLRDVAVVVAAPNCEFSPSQSQRALAVGMEPGPCVDVAARGKDVAGASHKSNDAYVVRTGASVSAAWATGVLAQLRESEPEMETPVLIVRAMEISEGGWARVPAPDDAFTKPTNVSMFSLSPRRAWEFGPLDDFCLQFTLASGSVTWQISDGVYVTLAGGRGTFLGGAHFDYPEDAREFRVVVQRQGSDGSADVCVLVRDATAGCTSTRFPVGATQTSSLIMADCTNVRRCVPPMNVDTSHAFARALQFEEPTRSPTRRVLDVPCERRSAAAECSAEPLCTWYGAVLGCTPHDFCGFKHPNACGVNAKSCTWVEGACHPRHETHHNDVRRRRALDAVAATAAVHHERPQPKPKHHRVYHRRPPGWERAPNKK